MDQPTLHELLGRLHAELQIASPLNAEDRALLHEVQADIRRLVETGPAGGAGSPPTADQREQSRGRLQDALARFASSHPKLAAELEGIFNALNIAGV